MVLRGLRAILRQQLHKPARKQGRYIQDACFALAHARACALARKDTKKSGEFFAELTRNDFLCNVGQNPRHHMIDFRHADSRLV